MMMLGLSVQAQKPLSNEIDLTLQVTGRLLSVELGAMQVDSPNPSNPDFAATLFYQVPSHYNNSLFMSRVNRWLAGFSDLNLGTSWKKEDGGLWAGLTLDQSSMYFLITYNEQLQSMTISVLERR